MQDCNVLSSKLKLDKLILRKIIKIVATILKLKCIKFDFGWGIAPDAAEGAYSAAPDRLAGFKALLLGEGKEGVREGRPVFSVQLVGNPNYLAYDCQLVTTTSLYPRGSKNL